MRRQTRTTAAATSSASDPVAQIGRDLASNWRQTWRIDEEPQPADAVQWHRLNRLEMHLSDRRYALEAMAAEIQASSLEGAMVQLMLAHSQADLIAADGKESMDAEMRTVSKLLHSALAVLERVSNVPREELGGEAYMRCDLDPHALVAEAEEARP